MNSLDSKESPDVRVSKARELLINKQISQDTLMKWISKSFSNEKDKSFRLSASTWLLFQELLLDDEFKADRLAIYMKPMDLLPVYQSDFYQEAFKTIEILIEKYPDAWRPNCTNLMEFISKMIQTNIHKKEVSLMMRILLNRPEVTASIKLVFDNANTFLLEPILQHIEELDQDLSFTLLATLLCVSFFVKKASNDTGKSTKELINALNKYPEAFSLFAPYLIRSFVKQMSLLNLPMSLNFPLQLIDGSKNLIIAAPLIRESRKLSMYKLMKESKDLPRLQSLAERSVKENRSDVLVELALIDFNSVRPYLKLILPNKKIATPQLSVVILKQCFEHKNPMIIFEVGDFPSHILSYPDFIHEFCDGISHLVAKQLLNVLSHLVSYSKRLEESCLLYWSIKSGRLTNEFDQIIDSLLMDCFTNPWRFSAAAIAAKKLQKQLPPPLEIVQNPTTHPVILDCFLCENYGMIEFSDNRRIEEIVQKEDKVPEIPSPYMNDKDALIYRISFIIRNLPNLAQSIEMDKLVEIISFVISNSIFATNLSEPETIADYCLNLIYNSAFYESKEVRVAFMIASLPLLPTHHMSQLEPHCISIDQFYRCAIIAALPSEFLAQKVTTAAFVGLFVTFEENETMTLSDEFVSELKLSDVFEELYKPETLVNCICNSAENISATFVKHNLTRIFSNCTNDSAIRLIPILLERLLPNEKNSNEGFEFPDLQIERPMQLISICNFCYDFDFPLPFEETLFEDDLESFCAQLRVGHPSAISYLLEIKEIEPHDALMIVTALNDMKNKNEDENLNLLDSQFPPDFLKFLIDSLVSNDEEESVDRVVTQFCSKLSIDLILYFLNVAPIFYYPSIFSAVNINKDEFDRFEPFIERLLRPEKNAKDKKTIEIPILKKMCSIRLSHIYSTAIVSRLLFLITSETIQMSLKMSNNVGYNCLNEICLLCQSVVQIINNCNRELSKQSTNTIEIVRKISSLFSRAIAKESPSYKQLKQFAKMFSAVSKVAYQDQLQYLIASFVSHLTLYKPDEKEHLKMRSLQTSVFPLFNRCSREQLNEVSASLHDSHREVFRQLSERWTNEAQYKGKV